jgi:hypothetical protein
MILLYINYRDYAIMLLNSCAFMLHDYITKRKFPEANLGLSALHERNAPEIPFQFRRVWVYLNKIKICLF